MIHTHQTAPTQFVQANGTRFAYRRFGKPGGVPLVFNLHYLGTMDYWDPAVTDGLARDREVILFDNAGVSSSSGAVPTTFEVQERSNPRAAFSGHNRDTPWDQLHLTYFLGYAIWHYLTTPFLFTQPGFETREAEPHVEGLETWRPLEVTYPDGVPAHTRKQTLYFDDAFMLRRLDYVTDVLGGVAAHYCYDPVTVEGIVCPTLRRVVRRTPDGPLLSGRTSFLIDFTNIEIQT